jgi:hypothetical protein
MKQIFKTKVLRLWWLLWVMAGGHPSGALAQTDGGTLAPTGAITTSTCQLFIGDAGAATFSSTSRVMNLGNGTSNSGTFATPLNGALGIPTSVSFVLANAGTSTPDLVNGCTSVGSGSWNISLQLANTQLVARDDGYVVLKNQITPAQGGTNAAVALWGFSTTSSSTILSFAGSAVGIPLTSGQGLAGNLVSPASNAPVPKNGKIWLSAQLGRAANNTTPTNGPFSTSIPLVVVYK